MLPHTTSSRARLLQAQKCVQHRRSSLSRRWLAFSKLVRLVLLADMDAVSHEHVSELQFGGR
jgi:hypothetical protein